MTTIIFLVILMFMLFLKLLTQGLLLVHRLQQLGYSDLKLVKWLEGRQYREILLWNIFELLLPLLIILLLYYNIKQIPIYKYITSTIMLLTFAWKLVHPFTAKWVGRKAYVKVPLVYTSRVKRLIATLIVVIIFTLFFVFIFTVLPLDTFTLSTWRFFRFNAFLLFISVITPVMILISNLIISPVEALVHYGYFNKAKNKLKRVKTKNIGITGSYGKTSTKYFLAKILEEKYKVLFTPASYNTPMGISKIINQNDLDDIELFIAEMGADKSGDINTLCRLVNPTFGIISAIDIQHLETFGTSENIINTKLSLFKNLPSDGFGIYNYDSPLLLDNINRFEYKCRLFSYSMNEINTDKVDIIAKDIKHTRDGLVFKAVLKDSISIDIKAAVLGRHNTLNLLAAILMANKMGLSAKEIENGINKIEPVEHRLQMIKAPSGVLILDDAFNSNLNGATEALRVLNEIEGNKKVIITPGMIGLGEKEEEINKIFGNNIAKFADIAILVGKEKTRSIYDGIIEGGLDKDNLIVTSSLEEAKDELKHILTAGDIVLFENDLPDTYNE